MSDDFETRRKNFTKKVQIIAHAKSTTPRAICRLLGLRDSEVWMLKYKDQKTTRFNFDVAEKQLDDLKKRLKPLFGAEKLTVTLPRDGGDAIIDWGRDGAGSVLFSREILDSVLSGAEKQIFEMQLERKKND
jgi:hypothetical protein